MRPRRGALPAVLGLAAFVLSASCDRPTSAPPAATPARAATAPPPPSARDPPPRESYPDAPPPDAPREPEAPTMSQRETRRLVERVVKDRSARDLSSQEYDRLADAVLRLRAAAHELRTADDSPAGLATRARERDAMQQALADIQTISGLQASDLGDALGNDARVP